MLGGPGNGIGIPRAVGHVGKAALTCGGLAVQAVQHRDQHGAVHGVAGGEAVVAHAREQAVVIGILHGLIIPVVGLHVCKGHGLVRHGVGGGGGGSGGAGGGRRTAVPILRTLLLGIVVRIVEHDVVALLDALFLHAEVRVAAIQRIHPAGVTTVVELLQSTDRGNIIAAVLIGDSRHAQSFGDHVDHISVLVHRDAGSGDPGLQSPVLQGVDLTIVAVFAVAHQCKRNSDRLLLAAAALAAAANGDRQGHGLAAIRDGHGVVRRGKLTIGRIGIVGDNFSPTTAVHGSDLHSGGVEKVSSLIRSLCRLLGHCDLRQDGGGNGDRNGRGLALIRNRNFLRVGGQLFRGNRIAAHLLGLSIGIDCGDDQICRVKAVAFVIASFHFVSGQSNMIQRRVSDRDWDLNIRQLSHVGHSCIRIQIGRFPARQGNAPVIAKRVAPAANQNTAAGQGKDILIIVIWHLKGRAGVFTITGFAPKISLCQHSKVILRRRKVILSARSSDAGALVIAVHLIVKDNGIHVIHTGQLIRGVIQSIQRDS